MAGRSPGSASYTVVIIPLKTSLYSLDALRFYLWIRRLKDLEKEKDALWCGLEILDQARLWYLQRLEENRLRQGSEAIGLSEIAGLVFPRANSCLLRSRMQRANGSLGYVINEPNMTSSSTHSLPETVDDSDLRWHNTVLTKEVSNMNHQISLLQMEKGALLEELEELQTH